MRLHGGAPSRAWVVVILVVLLIASHLLAFHALSRRTWPIALATGAVAIVAIKHLGLIGALVAWLRRRSARR